MLRLVFPVLALMATLVWFAFVDTDVRVQDVLFDSASGVWFWDKDDPLLRVLFYTGPKVLIILCGVAALGFLLFSRSPARKRALLVVVLSLALVPLLVGGLKTVTHVPCPSKTERYGGVLPTGTFWEGMLDADSVLKGQRCFPAGHASGGFALLAMMFLFPAGWSRLLTAGGIITVATGMAFYKMAIGDHYLSHTLVSLEIALIVIAGLHYMLMERKTGKKPPG